MRVWSTRRGSSHAKAGVGSAAAGSRSPFPGSTRSTSARRSATSRGLLVLAVLLAVVPAILRAGHLRTPGPLQCACSGALSLVLLFLFLDDRSPPRRCSTSAATARSSSLSGWCGNWRTSPRTCAFFCALTLPAPGSRPPHHRELCCLFERSRPSSLCRRGPGSKRCGALPRSGASACRCSACAANRVGRQVAGRRLHPLRNSWRVCSRPRDPDSLRRWSRLADAPFCSSITIAADSILSLCASPAQIAALWITIPQQTIERLATTPGELCAGAISTSAGTSGPRAGRPYSCARLRIWSGSFVAQRACAPSTPRITRRWLCWWKEASLRCSSPQPFSSSAARVSFSSSGPLRIALGAALLDAGLSVRSVATVQENRATWLLPGCIAVAARLAAKSRGELATAYCQQRSSE